MNYPRILFSLPLPLAWMSGVLWADHKFLSVLLLITVADLEVTGYIIRRNEL